MAAILSGGDELNSHLQVCWEPVFPSYPAYIFAAKIYEDFGARSRYLRQG